MRVSIEEAARLLGVSTYTVRRRLNSGTLAGDKEPMGKNFRWWVILPDEVGLATRGDEEGDLVALLRSELEAWKLQAQRGQQAQAELRILLLREQERTAALEMAVPDRPRRWWEIWRR
jgi:hypothetical protein